MFLNPFHHSFCKYTSPHRFIKIFGLTAPITAHWTMRNSAKASIAGSKGIGNFKGRTAFLGWNILASICCGWRHRLEPVLLPVGSSNETRSILLSDVAVTQEQLLKREQIFSLTVISVVFLEQMRINSDKKNIYNFSNYMNLGCVSNKCSLGMWPEMWMSS